MWKNATDYHYPIFMTSVPPAGIPPMQAGTQQDQWAVRHGRRNQQVVQGRPLAQRASSHNRLHGNSHSVGSCQITMVCHIQATLATGPTLLSRKGTHNKSENQQITKKPSSVSGIPKLLFLTHKARMKNKTSSGDCLGPRLQISSIRKYNVG